MTMIYFGGRLDHSPLTQANPVVIRGYDRAGNLLATIRSGALESAVPGSSGVAFSAYQSDGTLTACQAATNDPYPAAIPAALVADTAGRIYTATASTWAINTATGINTEVWPDWFRVYRRGGDRLAFPQLHGGPIRVVVLDGSGNLYVGGDQVGAEKYILRKYDSGGTLLWSAGAVSVLPDIPDRVLGIAVDGSGNVYTAGGKDYGGGLVRKYNSSGVLQWTQRPAGIQTHVALDGAGNVYTSGVFSAGYWLIDTTFSPWSTIPGFLAPGPSTADFQYYGPPPEWPALPAMHAIAKWATADGAYVASATGNLGQRIVWNDGVLHASHQWEGTSDNTRKNYKRYNAALTITYERETDIGQNRRLGAVGSDGTAYFVGYREGQTVNAYPYSLAVLWHFSAIDLSNALLWTGLSSTATPDGRNSDGQTVAEAYAEHQDLSEYVALYEDAQYTNAYGALVGPDFWAEFWDSRCAATVDSTLIPALSLGFTLRAPTWIGDLYHHSPGLPLAFSLRAPTLLREYVGPRLQTIYRAVVDGVPPLTVPLASVQCRRTTGGIEMTLVTPFLPSATLTELLTRIDADLIVYRGVRFASGLEQLDELVRVTLTGTRLDAGPHRWSLTLSGNADAETANPKLRIARGISYRNLGTDGSRRVRCEVDTYLRPGDTVDLGGGETLVVSDLIYNLRPDSSLMELSEVAP